MTICKITGYACNCQPDEGKLCDGAAELRKACHEWRTQAEKLRGELSLAEEGLANYAQEIAQLRTDLTAARLERDEFQRHADRLNVRVWALATLLYPYVPPREAVAGDVGWRSDQLSGDV